MKKLHAKITGMGAYVPDYILTNDELSQMMDTNDEWIMTRIGVKERHILKEEGLGTSYMAGKAVKQLLKKTNTKPEEVDALICATVTPDHMFPCTAVLTAELAGIKNAYTFDLNAACSSFTFGLTTAAALIESGRYKKIILVGADKMSSFVDYTNRATAPIFGDGAGAVLLEPTEEEIGFIDSKLYSDGIGYPHLHLKAGGSAIPPSHETIDNKEHYIYQEGQVVFKHAVSKMADVSVEIMERNNLSHDDIAWVVPHQANLRIIDAVANRMGVDKDKVMVNIEKYGNTTSATLPLCLNEWEPKLKKGDKIVLATFGAGFCWGAAYIIWAYDGKES
ncbi:beta-ketoacyl-ACP synthase III [Paludibacter sp.]|uniref:beta-ketoacyl-ACP synthase III n=1 Tax=Paludibacter sp. TaxID=1898105 RepID=UPI0013551086|nr:beta-ketoacyl-ACP synthase III [Paludibacter sp.]MTK54414.1 ketoacyl-ACP synthase III [Paludibacter sp.]